MLAIDGRVVLGLIGTCIESVRALDLARCCSNMVKSVSGSQYMQSVMLRNKLAGRGAVGYGADVCRVAGCRSSQRVREKVVVLSGSLCQHSRRRAA